MQKIDLAYHHVQAIAPSLRPLAYYLRLQEALNEWSASGGAWRAVAARFDVDDASAAPYASHGRDVVAQLLALDFRVVGASDGGATRSLLLRSADAGGAAFLVTALADGDERPGAPPYLTRAYVERALAAHGGRCGVCALAFASSDPAAVAAAYGARHPRLLDRCDKACVDCFYFYDDGAPDAGTVLRFLPPGPVRGLAAVEATFPEAAVPCFSDHWVANVRDRLGTLRILEDTLGLLPQVEFESGVVAAGEAVIESTVAGSAAGADGDALRSRRQIFLPINNPLSAAGHVAGYLRELGQGVQHVANRVPDLVRFVKRANATREATGEGVAFLDVPRAYYGRIAGPGALAKAAGCGEAAARAALATLEARGLVDGRGVVALDADAATIAGALGDAPHAPALAEAAAVARYGALHGLLGDVFTEDQYVAIVANRVLVDVQGGDVLLQLFTKPVLQGGARDEAPFLEFIQRVCGAGKAPRAGCGGFGVRNFLVLFLSIELNAAMSAAMAAPDAAARARAAQAVACLSRQLERSGPVLGDVADAAADEAVLLEAGAAAHDVAAARARKAAAQDALKAIAADHAAEMRSLRG